MGVKFTSAEQKLMREVVSLKSQNKAMLEALKNLRGEFQENIVNAGTDECQEGDWLKAVNKVIARAEGK
jgi:hypothetical protein